MAERYSIKKHRGFCYVLDNEAKDFDNEICTTFTDPKGKKGKRVADALNLLNRIEKTKPSTLTKAALVELLTIQSTP